MPTEQQLQRAIQAGYTPQQIKLALARSGQTQPKEKTIGGFLGNVASSGASAVGGIVNAVAHPIDTAKAIGQTSIGALQLLRPGEQGYEQKARDIGSFYKQRYGGIQNIKDTLYNDPVGAALDASAVLGGAGAVVKGVGTAGKVGKLSSVGKGFTTASEIVDPFNIASKTKLLPTRFKPNIASKLGKKVSEFGDTYAIKSTRINDRNQAKLAQTMKGMNTKFGNNLESLVDKTGLYGQDLGAVDKYIKPLEDFRDAQIVQSGATAQSGELLKNFGNKIAELSTPEAMRDPASRALRQQLIEEASLFAQQNPVRRSNLSLESLNTTRKSLDQNTPNAQFESGKSALQRSLGNVYRDTVNTSAGTGKAGKELSVLYKFRDMLEKAPKGKNTLPMGITQSIATGTGFLSGADPIARVANAVIGYGASSIANSPKFIGALSKGAKSVSKFKSPTILSKFSGGAYNYGKVGRMLPNPGSGQDISKQKKPQTPAEQLKTYRSSVPQTPTRQFVTKEIKYNAPANPFKNKSSFGKTKKVKAGSFN